MDPERTNGETGQRGMPGVRVLLGPDAALFPQLNQGGRRVVVPAEPADGETSQGNAAFLVEVEGGHVQPAAARDHGWPPRIMATRRKT